MNIVRCTLAGLLFTALFAMQAVAEVRIHEYVVETTTRATPVPSFETATFVVTRCIEGCAGNQVRLTTGTRYYLGAQESTLKELREAAALTPHRIVVFFTRDGTVTRVQLSNLAS